jgi:phosphoglycolate phosphatase
MTQRRTALIFDFDGTLVDTAPDLHAALNRLLAEAGRPAVALDDVKAMVGEGAARLVERGFADTGGLPDGSAFSGLVARYLELYADGRHALTRPFSGVPSTLSVLAAAGYRFGICTNKPHQFTLEILDLLDLRARFAAVSAGDSLAVRKPDPRHLLAVLADLGAGPEEAVMVGDSAIDVAVARAADVPVIAVSYGYTRTPAHALGADAVIDEFAALPAALAKPPFAESTRSS